MSSLSGAGSAQDTAYPTGHDYSKGSPHLRHAELRTKIEQSLTDEVNRIRAEHGRCRVLEVGAGHGSFTATLRDAGAEVTVTDMSGASAAHLRTRFGSDPGVAVIKDIDGTWAFDPSTRSTSLSRSPFSTISRTTRGPSPAMWKSLGLAVRVPRRPRRRRRRGDRRTASGQLRRNAPRAVLVDAVRDAA